MVSLTQARLGSSSSVPSSRILTISSAVQAVILGTVYVCNSFAFSAITLAPYSLSSSGERSNWEASSDSDTKGEEVVSPLMCSAAARPRSSRWPPQIFQGAASKREAAMERKWAIAL